MPYRNAPLNLMLMYYKREFSGHVGLQQDSLVQSTKKELALLRLYEIPAMN